MEELLIQQLNGEIEAISQNADVSVERLAELAGVQKPKKPDKPKEVEQAKTVEQLAKAESEKK